MTVNVFTHYQNCVNLRALAEARGVRPKRKTLWARWGRPGRPKAPRRPALRLAARATLVGLVFVGGFSLASRDPAPVLFFSLAL
ncbi:MAG TPA: hypothetical protein VNO81_03730, partial [Candidatus Nitrosotenuis sp.]|nr:hypothetical protein [Candidatus Nitrosotenuis sp.]